MRVQLAAEGPSDEIYGTGLITPFCPGATVVCKSFPAPGFSIVERLAPMLPRAGHFGFYELLVVHFDIDDTLGGALVLDVVASPRWKKIDETIRGGLAGLPQSGRAATLQFALMAPCQSTDAWVTWGMNGG